MNPAVLLLTALVSAAPGPNPGEILELRRHDFDPALCQRMIPSRHSNEVIYLTTGKRVYSLSRTTGVALPLDIGVRGLRGQVVDIAEDDRARVWVGTTRGLAGEGLPVDALRALTGQAVSRIVSWPPGRLLIAAERGLYLVDGAGTRMIADPGLGYLKQVIDILPVPDGPARVAWRFGKELAVSEIEGGPSLAVRTRRAAFPWGPVSPGPLGEAPGPRLVCGAYDLGDAAWDVPLGPVRLLPQASQILVTGGMAGPAVRRTASHQGNLYFAHGMTAPGLSVLSRAGWSRIRDMGAVFDFFVEASGTLVLALHDGLFARTPGGETVPILGVSGPGNHVMGLATLPLGQGVLGVSTERGVQVRQSDGTWSLLQAGESRQLTKVTAGAYALVGGLPYQVGRGFLPSTRRLNGVTTWAAAGDRWLILGRDSTLILHDPILGITRPAYELPGPCLSLATSGANLFAAIGGPTRGLWIGRLASPVKPTGGPDLSSTQLEIHHVTFLALGSISGFVTTGTGAFIATDRSLYRFQEGKLNQIHDNPSETYHFLGSWGDDLLLFMQEGRAALVDRQGKSRGYLDLPFLTGETVTGLEARGDTAWIGTEDSGLFEVLATGRAKP